MCLFQIFLSKSRYCRLQ